MKSTKSLTPAPITTEDKMRRLIAENMGVESVYDEQGLEDLGESLDLMESVVAIENEFRIALDDDLIMDFTTVGQLVEFAASKRESVYGDAVSGLPANTEGN